MLQNVKIPLPGRRAHVAQSEHRTPFQPAGLTRYDAGEDAHEAAEISNACRGSIAFPVGRSAGAAAASSNRSGDGLRGERSQWTDTVYRVSRAHTEIGLD